MPSDDPDPPDGGDSDTGEPPTGPPADPAAANPYVDGRAMAARGDDAGPLFADQFRPGQSGATAGLVAGDAAAPVLVAGVGYPLLGDLALGTVVAYRVADWDLPGVAVADCSHTPVAAYQTITGGDHEAAVLVGAEKRGGALNDGTPSDDPGAVHEYTPDDFATEDARVVERVGESAMGSNTVENVVLVSRALGELPPATRVVTVEPGYDSWGLAVDEFTDPVERALGEVLDRVRAHVEDVHPGL